MVTVSQTQEASIARISLKQGAKDAERFGSAANTADAEAFETAKFGFSELLADLDEDLKEDLINL